jgi:hypothetical protein
VDSAWEAIFMLLVLKIPIVYLAIVVWWAVRAEPTPGEGEHVPALVPLTPCGWNDWRSRRRVTPRLPSHRPFGSRGSSRAPRRVGVAA